MQDLWKKCAEEEVVQALNMAVVVPDESFTKKTLGFLSNVKKRYKREFPQMVFILLFMHSKHSFNHLLKDYTIQS